MKKKKAGKRDSEKEDKQGREMWRILYTVWQLTITMRN